MSCTPCLHLPTHRLVLPVDWERADIGKRHPHLCEVRCRIAALVGCEGRALQRQGRKLYAYVLYTAGSMPGTQYPIKASSQYENFGDLRLVAMN